MEDIIKVGKWLEFDANTCFGTKTMHFGIILGIDDERRMAVVAANATSKIEKLIWFADRNNIPIEDAMVDVTSDIHFSKPTGIDCHRPREIPLSQLHDWAKRNMIRLSPYNTDVDSATMQKIISIVLRSPLVEKSIKNIIKDSQ